MSVLEWAKFSPFQGQNHMVRMFAGMIPPDLPKHYLDQMDAIWPYFDYDPPVGWNAASIPAVTRADLDRAKKVLQRFTVVLSLDWLPECAPLLNRWLNIEVEDIRARYWWGSIQAAPKRRRKHPQPLGEHAELFTLNELDMELWAFARSLCRCNGERLYWRDHEDEKKEDGACLRAHRGVSPEVLAVEQKKC